MQNGLYDIRLTAEDASGKQAAYIDKRNYRTEYFYDALGNLERVSYPDGTEETFVYDAEGRNTSSVNREGKETVYTYDKLGRLIRTEAPDGSYTETVYDARGQVSKQIDERGNETSYTYDVAGRNTEVRNALTHPYPSQEGTKSPGTAMPWMAS